MHVANMYVYMHVTTCYSYCGCVCIIQVIETLRGVLCQKVCASSQFSLILSAAGKVRICIYEIEYKIPVTMHKQLRTPLLWLHKQLPTPFNTGSPFNEIPLYMMSYTTFLPPPLLCAPPSLYTHHLPPSLLGVLVWQW